MREFLSLLVGLMSVLLPSMAFAEGAGGSYRGIGQIYYTFIAAVLIYGVYDTFGKKAMYIVGPIIVVALYVMLPKG
ncbi:MAG: hypothetical protein ACT4OO_07395 [Nitrospiraceae bacterium]